MAVPQPVYRIWRSMISRCHDLNDRAYYKYGGRGIVVCDTWRSSFEAFFSAMGHKQPGESIARHDSDKGYEPGNCYWATRAEQRRNARNVRTVTLNGKSLCFKDAARVLGISEGALSWRVRARGMTYQEAVNYYAIRQCEE
jgi:hypothetical protein